MEAIFLKLLNMSISAGWLILTIIVLRFLLKKIMPKSLRCILWALVGIRLICPFSVESVLSLIPSAETVSPGIIYADTPEIDSGFSALDSVVNPVISESLTPSEAESVNPMQIVLFAVSVLWIAGMAALMLYSIISYLRLRRKTAVSMKLRDNIFLCDEISSPFILGIVKPKIYLPSNISQQHLYYVSAHEKTHLKRHDNLWKPVGYALLTVYWFNPLVWAAYILFCRDIELACDERVIKNMSADEKKEYSQTLLSYSIVQKSITACPVAFGEVGLKERVKSILSYKKAAVLSIIITVIVCIATAVCMLTDPKTEKSNSSQILSGMFSNAANMVKIQPPVSSNTGVNITEGTTFNRFVTISGKTENITYTWQDCGGFYIGLDENINIMKDDAPIGYLPPCVGFVPKTENSDCVMLIFYSDSNLLDEDVSLLNDSHSETTTLGGYKAYVSKGVDGADGAEYNYIDVVIEGENALLITTIEYDEIDEEWVQRMYAMLDTIIFI